MVRVIFLVANGDLNLSIFVRTKMLLDLNCLSESDEWSPCNAR